MFICIYKSISLLLFKYIVYSLLLLLGFLYYNCPLAAVANKCPRLWDNKGLLSLILIKNYKSQARSVDIINRSVTMFTELTSSRCSVHISLLTKDQNRFNLLVAHSTVTLNHHFHAKQRSTLAHITTDVFRRIYKDHLCPYV